MGRSRHFTGCLIASLTAACVEIPPALPTDGGNAVDGSNVDASAPACGTKDGFSSEDALSNLGTLDLRDAIGVDINRDGDDDMIVRSVAAGNEVIYVLLGPLDGSQPVVYQTIQTLATPLGMQVGNFDEDEAGCLDLAVLGRNKQNTNAGMLEIYVNNGATETTPLSATSVSIEVPLVANLDAPVLIEAGVFDDGPRTSLILADLDEVYLVRFPGLIADTLDQSNPTQILMAENLLSVNAVLAFPNGTGDQDDLVIIENAFATLVRRDGGGALTDATTMMHSDGAVSILGVAVAPLGGQNMRGDVIGTGFQSLGAWVFDHTGPAPLAVRPVPWSQPNILSMSGIGNGDGEVEDIAVGDFGGSALPDIVIIDRDTTNGSQAVAILDVREQGGSMLPMNAQNPFAFAAGFHPRTVAQLDADGDGDNDVYVLDPISGLGQCLEINSVQALVPCQ